MKRNGMTFNYYVNEDKRTIVCTITNCERSLIEKVRKRMGSHFGDYFRFRGDRSYIADKFVGKAKCNPLDTWDEQTGMDIARERALRKFNRAFNRELTDVIVRLEDLVPELDSLYKDEFYDED